MKYKLSIGTVDLHCTNLVPHVPFLNNNFQLGMAFLTILTFPTSHQILFAVVVEDITTAYIHDW